MAWNAFSLLDLKDNKGNSSTELSMLNKTAQEEIQMFFA